MKSKLMRFDLPVLLSSKALYSKGSGSPLLIFLFLLFGIRSCRRGQRWVLGVSPGEKKQWLDHCLGFEVSLQHDGGSWLSTAWSTLLSNAPTSRQFLPPQRHAKVPGPTAVRRNLLYMMAIAAGRVWVTCPPWHLAVSWEQNSCFQLARLSQDVGPHRDSISWRAPPWWGLSLLSCYLSHPDGQQTGNCCLPCSITERHSNIFDKIFQLGVQLYGLQTI